MARLAIILLEGSPTRSQLRLGRILDFFGVPWETVEVSKLADVESGAQGRQVVFGSAQTVAAAVKQGQRATHVLSQAAAFYVYAGDDRSASSHALQSLFGDADFSLREAPAGDLSIRVSPELTDVAGPMAGLEVLSRLKQEDAVLVGGSALGESRFETVISAGGAPVFLRFQQNGVPVFFCASSYMVDIDHTVGTGFYDVKQHFCSAVPLIMFLRFMFRETAWHPQELSACLIVDDPLLKQRYGHCDFVKLRALMRQYGFTTNIAFIPWNWRRTSAADAEFFRRQSEHFSVSIHGCDHIEDEFGTTSFETLDGRAWLAQFRMENHERRTGIHHDGIMIFPQGVFSSVCPEALKRNGFLAAVNTEIMPVDGECARTRFRDVWDVAIRSYGGGFPIFTRRYAFHGLENFAFDLLLGKPCLIVSHHEFFRDGCVEVIELMAKLRSLNCHLHWRSLGDVIRNACRRRVTRAGVEEAEMYGNELLIDNPSNQEIGLRVRKQEKDIDLIDTVLSNGAPVPWKTEANHVVVTEELQPYSHKKLQVLYRRPANAVPRDSSIRSQASVTLRRMLCELRDDYLSRSRFLSSTAAGLKNLVNRPN